jgi:hypothetical protein
MDAQNVKLTYEFPEFHGDERLRELILHIATQYIDAPKFGKTKLNKILFFSDFISFQQTGKPITGVEYMHLPKGPAPKRMKPVCAKMIANHDIEVIKRPTPGGYEQHRIIPQKNANLDKYFTSAQIALVDEMIRVFWNADAETTSEVSHKTAWKVFNNFKEPIPYEAALLSDDDITVDDIERTGELAKKYGW